MFIRKSFYLSILFIALWGISSLCAGDSATYADLGFSPDGRVYFFGQFGIQAATLKPWAELNGVEVLQNRFIAGGRLSYIHNTPVVPGQNGSGALYQLISKNSALLERHKLSFLFLGQSLYLDLDEAKPEGPISPDRAIISFRDFDQGASYTATLVSQVETSPPRSSFSINLERTGGNGEKKTYAVGNPQIKRAQVASYLIRRVILSPQKNALIFVIEMKVQGDAGYDIRYMVETQGL